MNKIVRTILSTSLLAATAALLVSPLSASAGEGNSSTSVGKGIKCRWVSIVQPDGTVVRQQVCSKGV